MGLTSKLYPYPDSTAPNNVPADIQALANAVDGAPGISIMSSTSRDALSGGSLYAGRTIWNTTTGQMEAYNGSIWLPVGSAAPHPFLFTEF